MKKDTSRASLYHLRPFAPTKGALKAGQGTRGAKLAAMVPRFSLLSIAMRLAQSAKGLEPVIREMQGKGYSMRRVALGAVFQISLHYADLTNGGPQTGILI